jgi:copper transport protein
MLAGMGQNGRFPVRHLIIIFTLFWLLVATAVSHALVSYAFPTTTTPAEGETVRGTPRRVVMQFSQPLEPTSSQIQVFDSQGSRVDQQNCGIDVSDPQRSTMVVNLRPDLPAGSYTVRWTAVSAETNETLNGQYQFTIAPTVWQLAGKSILITAAGLFAFGGWAGFAFTYHQLQQLKNENGAPASSRSASRDAGTSLTEESTHDSQK